MSATFRKYERLRRKKDFQRVFQEGQKVRSTSFVLYILQDQSRQYRRLGITASKKVGNAVARNRCKRLIRECFQRNKAQFPQGSDLIVVVKRDMVGKRYIELVEEFYSILHT